MANLSKILAPVEFSPRCQGAVQYAEALARQFHSEIVLLHVIAPPMAYFGPLDGPSYYTNEELTRSLETSRTDALDAFPCDVDEGVNLQRMIRHGDPARTIVEVAASEHVDLIVMPTHGYGPFRRFLLGSVTAKVLHDAACPVWTGPHMEDAPDPAAFTLKRMLCAVDLGPHTRAVMCWAGRFAAQVSASITIVHAIPSSTTRLGPMYFDPEWRLMLIGQARERLEFLKGDMGIQGEVLVDSGEAAVVVRDAARDRKVDLVVMGRGHSAHAHPRLPTHAYAIARDAPCPSVAV
jgi:nucleotide-binding universal stress UspA family protein